MGTKSQASESFAEGEHQSSLLSVVIFALKLRRPDRPPSTAPIQLSRLRSFNHFFHALIKEANRDSVQKRSRGLLLLSICC